jgi:hypothetical protein
MCCQLAALPPAPPPSCSLCMQLCVTPSSAARTEWCCCPVHLHAYMCTAWQPVVPHHLTSHTACSPESTSPQLVGPLCVQSTTAVGARAQTCITVHSDHQPLTPCDCGCCCAPGSCICTAAVLRHRCANAQAPGLWRMSASMCPRHLSASWLACTYAGRCTRTPSCHTVWSDMYSARLCYGQRLPIGPHKTNTAGV